MTTFLMNIDLKNNQLLNAVVQNLATAPSNGRKGQIYFDTTDGQFKVFDGETWQAMGGLDREAVEAIVADSQSLAQLGLAIKDAVDEAKTYADSIKSDLLGSASEDYDTLKEIEDLIKKNAAELELIGNVPKKVVATIGDGVGLAHTVEHGLGSRDVTVTLRLTKAPYEVVLADVELTTADSLTVRTAEPLAQDEVTVTVVG